MSVPKFVFVVGKELGEGARFVIRQQLQVIRHRRALRCDGVEEGAACPVPGAHVNSQHHHQNCRRCREPPQHRHRHVHDRLHGHDHRTSAATFRKLWPLVGLGPRDGSSRDPWRIHRLGIHMCDFRNEKNRRVGIRLRVCAVRQMLRLSGVASRDGFKDRSQHIRGIGEIQT
eukprot:3481165-Rhodomonas_salina.4